MGSWPGIAGRSPSYMMRQLYDIKAGARAGAGTALKKAVVAKLDNDDMAAIVAYLATQAP
jgi:cytochrome c553